MCFRIDKTAKRPKQKKVYKILALNRGTLLSPLHGYDLLEWYGGATIEIEKRAKTRAYGYTSAGIYVFFSRKEAKRSWIYRNGVGRVIVSLDVQPKDWLYSSHHGTATYRKVTVSKRQPDITWTY